MLFALALAAQLPTVYSTPASGDTAGYWQQRVHYTIAATLDERPGVLHATGTLLYVNNSPDTLREFYVHQHLNAFRPGSKWSATDEREGRVRFQRLRDPDYAYERFTAVPTFGGAPVRPQYPGAPDSTVARFVLPRALPPRDSLTVAFAWDARPSTLPRRQGRRGRSFDFAQWYPKVAVYDRGRWQPNALVPAGEFYGEFGTYDVTLVVRGDQVLAASGIPVSGDPGWARARVAGSVRLARDAYGGAPAGLVAAVPAGFKAVRFVARDVHHFGWSTSPDYRYEGGVVVRPVPVPEARALPFRAFDSVSVHVLYRPGDEAEWGQGKAVERTASTIRWLERIYGPYAYPQMTTLHRIESGGTEFPMLMMNGSASPGLILHEGGHIYSYGILANNEWRSGWMDEGLTSYQTSWALGTSPQDRRGRGSASAPRGRGYRALGVRPSAAEEGVLQLVRLDLLGRAQPIGTRADRFRDFGTYNTMIYSRAAQMYGALRDAVGDTAFTGFLHDYYGRWALKHVDELAMRRSAERAAGRDLGWFFDQWVHRTGLVDYALAGARSGREGKGWVTRARVARRGEYRHPMPVGVRSAAGWTVVRGDALRDQQTIEIRTHARPVEVRLDPFETTTDWYRPNNVRGGLFDPRATQLVFGWPLLEQAQAGRRVVTFTPLVWTSTPGGPTFALRAQSNYQRVVNRIDAGFGLATRAPEGSEGITRLHGWAAVENPRLFGATRPAMGLRAGAWLLDGTARLDVGRTWDRSGLGPAPGARTSLSLGAVGVIPYDRRWPDPRRWSLGRSYELRGAFERRAGEASPTLIRAELGAGYATRGDALGGGGSADAPSGGFGRAVVEARRLFTRGGGRQVTMLRGYGGASVDAPRERLIYASSLDPVQSFENHFFRPRGGVLSGPDAHYLSVGNGGLRAYDFALASRSLAAVNVEHAVRLRRFGPAARPLDVYAGAFADGGALQDVPPVGGVGDDTFLADAGVGLSARGAVFDREVRLRVDLPLYASHPRLVVSERESERGPVAFRAAFSFTDLW